MSPDAGDRSCPESDSDCQRRSDQLRNFPPADLPARQRSVNSVNGLPPHFCQLPRLRRGGYLTLQPAFLSCRVLFEAETPPVDKSRSACWATALMRVDRADGGIVRRRYDGDRRRR